MIKINDAITAIKTNAGEFTVSFIKADGSRKRVVKCRNGMPVTEKKIERIKTGEQSEWAQKINKQHNLLLFDIEKQRPFELKIPLITQYNGVNILWHRKQQ